MNELSSYEQMGRDAFAAGKKAVPVLDRDLMSAIQADRDERPSDPSWSPMPMMSAWVRGWHEANLAAPVPGWSPEEHAAMEQATGRRMQRQVPPPRGGAREALRAAQVAKQGYYGGPNVRLSRIGSLGREALYRARNTSQRTNRYFVLERLPDGTPADECGSAVFVGDGDNPIRWVRNYGAEGNLPAKWAEVLRRARERAAEKSAK